MKTVRRSGTYVRLGEDWFASPMRFAEGEAVSFVSTFAHEGDETSRHLVSAVSEIVRVTSTAWYSGYAWEVLSLVRGDPARHVREPVKADSTDVIALLDRYNHDDRAVADAVPGAVYHDPRGTNGGVTVEVPVADLTDYAETVTPITGVRQGRDRWFARMRDRTPIALFRRRVDGDVHYDEVFRGEWVPDVHGAVQRAVTIGDADDIEELTEDEGRSAELTAKAGVSRVLPPRAARDTSMLQILRYGDGVPLTRPGY